MNRLASLFPLLILFITSCTSEQKDSSLKVVSINEDLTQFVNPFIGTGGHGHTFPGATLPFGMVQLSPDTRLEGWDGCGGYHYSDSVIYGFSHTHLSGTGVSDYGDVLLMPSSKVVFHNGANGSEGYGAGFDHKNEEASAGYYQVKLETGITVELTSTSRTGIHRYHFPSAEDQMIILDLEHRDKLLDFTIKKTSETSVEGLRRSEAWAKDQRLFFYISFSHPIKSEHYNRPDNPSVAVFEFDNPLNEPVTVKVGISPIDTEGARKNLEAEAQEKSFDELREEARRIWHNQLSKIAIEEGDHDRKTTFYTALYHSMIAPNLYQDVDGRHRGMDLEVHQTEDFDYYTVFSLWDTYRATHPLFTLIERERTNDFIKTMLAKYREGGIIPIWDLSACYTGCMIGYHGIPVIADAYLKGINDYDAELAFEAMKHSAQRDHLGLESYKRMGFIPVEEESESVSKTLEYAYDDWCIAQMAKAMRKEEEYQRFVQRAQSYKNLYDPSTGFFRGRFRNSWFGPFDPYEVNFNYTEANAWQYSLYVPQDITGHIEIMGGKAEYEAHLDSLFSAKTETAGRHQADISGLIGQYAHGNEPSHHMAYLYNFVGRPDKTQKRVVEILTTLYSNSPEGISGNEDCGQMSAWYVFSALGFYPVTPGTNQYIIGSPLIEKATIVLENGNSFTISAPGAGKKPYIKSAKLNGKDLNRGYLNHEEIMAGGTLVFELSSTPTNWAKEEVPVTAITEHLIITPPFITEGEVAFKEKTRIALGHIDPEAVILFKWKDQAFEKYVEPIEMKDAGELTVYAEKDGSESVRLTTRFHKIDPMISIELGSQYANEYSAGGDHALIDGIRGTSDFRTGTWQGYQNQDVEATVDLGRKRTLSKVETSFLRNQGSWIFLPTDVEMQVSPDGREWLSLGTKTFDTATRADETKIETMTWEVPDQEFLKVRLRAKTLGQLPEWHLGYDYGGTAWIFIDEISLEE
jgi:predicted alpha-1,2-mannosidase